MNDINDIGMDLDAQDLGLLMAGAGLLLIGGALIVQVPAAKEVFDRVLQSSVVQNGARSVATLIVDSIVGSVRSKLS